MDITIAERPTELESRIVVTAVIPIGDDDAGGRRLAGRVIDQLCSIGWDLCDGQGRGCSITWELVPLRQTGTEG